MNVTVRGKGARSAMDMLSPFQGSTTAHGYGGYSAQTARQGRIPTPPLYVREGRGTGALAALMEGARGDRMSLQPYMQGVQAMESGKLVPDVARTVFDPSPANILADIEDVVRVFREVKEALSGKHPSALDIFRLLLAEL